MFGLGAGGCAVAATRRVVMVVAMTCIGGLMLLPISYANSEKVVCAKDPLPKYLIDIKSHDGIDEEVRGGPIPAIDKCTAQVHVKSDDRWLIIAAGLPRTGSTWQYNAVTSLMKASRTDYKDLGFIRGEKYLEKILSDIPETFHAIMKIHPHQPEFALAVEIAAQKNIKTIVVTSYRNVVDEIISATGLDFGWIQSNIEESKVEFRERTMEGYKQASRYACSCCIMPYMQLSTNDDMRDELYKLAHVLGLGSDLGAGHIDIVLRHMESFECQRNKGRQGSSSANAEFRREEIAGIVKDMPDLVEWQSSLGYEI